MKTNVKRATVYIRSDLHRALRLKSVETDRTISDLVNEAVQLQLGEDAEDLAAFETRAGEPNLRFDLGKEFDQPEKKGLLAAVGAWEEFAKLDELVAHLYELRKKSRDRKVRTLR